MYGINLVQTKMDTAVRRGAIVKAMAIFSRYHYTDIFKEILSIALEAYFEEKNVSVLEGLYKTLNGVDLREVPCPNYLQQATFAREVAFHNDQSMLQRWTHSLSIEYLGSEMSIGIPFYRSPDEICGTNVERLVKVLGYSTMRVLHGLITR